MDFIYVNVASMIISNEVNEGYEPPSNIKELNDEIDDMRVEIIDRLSEVLKLLATNAFVDGGK